MSRILVVGPKRPGEVSGNDVTAARWARRLTELGHDAELLQVGPEADSFDHDLPEVADRLAETDVVFALHARRCSAVAGTVVRNRTSKESMQLVVGLAGTDLYIDLPAADADATASVAAADRLIVLQQHGLERLSSFAGSEALVSKAVVVHQSVDPPLPARRPDLDRLVVVVLAHLRDVKDPLLAARAAALMGPESNLKVLHAGDAHTPEWRELAEQEAATNPRYEWVGGVDQAEAMAMLARAHMLAITSRHEGGANVVSEAMALGVPVVGTRIGGTTGLLGEDHPGLVPVGDAAALAGVFTRCDSEAGFLDELERRSRELTPLTSPEHERTQLASLLE